MVSGIEGSARRVRGTRLRLSVQPECYADYSTKFPYPESKRAALGGSAIFCILRQLLQLITEVAQ